MTACARCAELEEAVAYYKSELGLLTGGDALRKWEARGLSIQEAQVMAALEHHKGRFLRPDVIAQHISTETRDEANLMQAIVAKIRRKLGKGIIKSSYGYGYMYGVENGT